MSPNVRSEELTADRIRLFRFEAGLSISEAARELRAQAPDGLPALASIVRSWKRWEAGTRPSGQYRPLLRALLAQARRGGPAAVDLSGDWWATWQTWKDGVERFAPQIVRIRQSDSNLTWWAATRGVEINNGGYLWRGELRLWDNAIVMGWYAAEDGSVQSKGVVYLRLNPHGLVMTGRWVGMSHDGPVVAGLGVLARSQDEALATVSRLAREERK